jgi:hypothetical protein
LPPAGEAREVGRAITVLELVERDLRPQVVQNPQVVDRDGPRALRSRRHRHRPTGRACDCGRPCGHARACGCGRACGRACSWAGRRFGGGRVCGSADRLGRRHERQGRCGGCRGRRRAANCEAIHQPRRDPAGDRQRPDPDSTPQLLLVHASLSEYGRPVTGRLVALLIEIGGTARMVKRACQVEAWKIRSAASSLRGIKLTRGMAPPRGR